MCSAQPRQAITVQLMNAWPSTGQLRCDDCCCTRLNNRSQDFGTLSQAFCTRQSGTSQTKQSLQERLCILTCRKEQNQFKSKKKIHPGVNCLEDHQTLVSKWDSASRCLTLFLHQQNRFRIQTACKVCIGGRQPTVGMPCQAHVDLGQCPGGPKNLCEGPPKSEGCAVVQMSPSRHPSPEVLCQEYDNSINLSSTLHQTLHHPTSAWLRHFGVNPTRNVETVSF